MRLLVSEETEGKGGSTVFDSGTGTRQGENPEARGLAGAWFPLPMRNRVKSEIEYSFCIEAGGCTPASPHQDGSEWEQPIF